MSSADYTKHAAAARSDFHSAIVQDLRPVDEVFKGLPWVGIEGKSLKIPRLGQSESPQFLGIASEIASGQDFTSGVPLSFRQGVDWAPVEFPLKTIATDRPVDDRILRELSEPHMQDQFEIQMGTDAVIQRFGYLFINGNTGAASDQFDGLAQLVSGTSQSTASSGASVASDMDTAISMITAGDGYPDAIIMCKELHGKLHNNSRAANGYTQLEAITHPVFGLRTHYRGIPLLRSDHIPLTGDPLSSQIYAVKFGPGVGLAGIFPQRNGEMGVRVEKRHDDDTDTWYYKIKLECGLALYCESAIAEITGVDTTF